MTNHRNTRSLAAALLITAGVFLVMVYMSSAAPTGASILSNSTSGVPSSTAESRADSRGTITTIVLSSVQQDQQWKAYVGNVSGSLSLDNAAGYTIYDWTLSGAVAGEVYVTRYSGPTFTNVSCATASNITVENIFLNMSDAQSDSINRTFSYTDHDAFLVGALPIAGDSCPSTATYLNSTAQVIDGTQLFQEIVLQDNSDRLIFVALIEDNTVGYNNQSYDFQIIVPENDINSTSTTYYFFTELDG